MRSLLRSFLFAAAVFALTACSTAQPPASASPSVASETSPSTPKGPKEGDELLGTKAHDWHIDRWINSPPLALEDLRGQVVLVRWFMSTECPLCSATAPSLRGFNAEYGSRGLRVIGMYHHKDQEPLDPAKVEKYVQRYGYIFPVGIDADWRTLKDWWLDGHDREYTSVTFVLDKEGVIRFIHPGGKYEPGSADEKELRGQVERLLAAK